MIPSWELTYPHPRYVWRWFVPFPKLRWDMYVSSLEVNSTKPLFQVLQELAGIHSKWFEWMSGLWKFLQILSKSPLIFQSVSKRVQTGCVSRHSFFIFEIVEFGTYASFCFCCKWRIAGNHLCTPQHASKVGVGSVQQTGISGSWYFLTREWSFSSCFVVMYSFIKGYCN